jgi:hypothetical protein
MAKLRDLISESKYLKREFGEPLPTFKGVMKQHQINKLEEGWWDNMSDKAKSAYIKKHGSAPGSAGGDEEPKTDIFGNVPEDPDVDPYGDDDDDWETHGVGPSFWDSPTPGNEPDDDAHQKGMDRASDLAKKGLTKGPGGYGDRGNVRGQDQAYFGEPDDEEYFKSMMGGDEDDEESSGRTGKELDQETLTIDGKQYRRISEGVEKQSKPKYEFSEFYERFKR